MFHKKLKINNDRTEAIIFARKGLATEHLPKSIKIDDTAINCVSLLRDLWGYIGLFTFIQAACNKHL